MWTLLLWLQSALAEPLCEPVEEHQELEVYLLTSGPGDGVYTKIGHSALWVSGGGKRETVFNWGAYDASQDNFLWHFFMGSAEYKLTMMSRPYNLKRVKENNQSLIAQHLDISPNMKLQLAAELARLARPENHTYTYHWETQNCATLIRDLINEVTDEGLSSLPPLEDVTTRRFEVLRHLESSWWAWFGWHYMGSDYGDRVYDRWSKMHIPQSLSEGVAQASIQWEGENVPRPLVDKTCVLNQGDSVSSEPPQRGLLLWGLGLIIAVLGWWSRDKPKPYRVPTCLFFMFSGGLSTFFIVCWLFCSLEGYGFNENWFFSNPLHFLVAWRIWQGKTSKPLKHLLGVLLVGGIGWKFIDSTPQQNLDIIGLFLLPTLIYLFAQSPSANDHHTEN